MLFKIDSNSYLLMLSSLKLKTPQLMGFLRTIYSIQKRATYPPIKSGMKSGSQNGMNSITHAKKHEIKAKKYNKGVKNTTTPITTSLMVQIRTQFHYFKYFFGNSSWNRVCAWKKVCLETPKKVYIQSRWICFLYVQTMYKF